MGDAGDQSEGLSKKNAAEARAVVMAAAGFVDAGLAPKDIGKVRHINTIMPEKSLSSLWRHPRIIVNGFVHPQFCIGIITPYAAQARLISSLLFDGAKSPLAHVAKDQRTLVSSVDAFQGQEKEVILLSLVRSNYSGALGFVKDWHRANVSLTRAKRGLVVFGDPYTLSTDPQTWGNFLRWIVSNSLLPPKCTPHFPQLPFYNQQETRACSKCLHTTKYVFHATEAGGKTPPASAASLHEGPSLPEGWGDNSNQLNAAAPLINQEAYQLPPNHMSLGGGLPSVHNNLQSSILNTAPANYSYPHSHPVPTFPPTTNQRNIPNYMPQIPLTLGGGIGDIYTGNFPVSSTNISLASTANMSRIPLRVATVTPAPRFSADTVGTGNFHSSSSHTILAPQKRARGWMATGETDRNRIKIEERSQHH